jgi:hypothetical protein
VIVNSTSLIVILHENFNMFSMFQTLIFDVADVEFWCCIHVSWGCCQGGVGRRDSDDECCKHQFFNALDVESRCCRHVLLGVANIEFRCCGCWVSMLQTCDVGISVEEEGRRTPDVGCCTQPRLQHDRNIVATWSQHGGGGRRPTDVCMLHAICSQHGSQHGPWTFFDVVKVYFECCKDSFPRCEHIFGCCEGSDGNVRFGRPSAITSGNFIKTQLHTIHFNEEIWVWTHLTVANMASHAISS